MRKTLFIGCILAVGGALSGCTVGVDGGTEGRQYAAPSVVDARDVGTHVDTHDGTPNEHLARLEELALFEVGGLLDYAPGGHYSCAYNTPCPGEEQDAARREQEARLAGLVAVAEDVRATEELPEVGDESASEHLLALSALSIVWVGDLVVDEPASSRECYNLPCPSDVEAAEQSNARRAAELAALADRAKDL